MSDQFPNLDELRLLFDEALELPAEQRPAFLDERCADDAALRSELDRMLSQRPDSDSVGSSDRAKRLGLVRNEPAEMIGPYKLLQKIGEGGFGIVYMADQVRPVTRRVALKILKAGMDTKIVLARFEAERQALAMMDHPNISRVLDAGETDSGRPYFVMELVKGVSITSYADENEMSIRERMELFRQVCSAVQHAHLKGVIHRDLKPSNIMVTLHDGKPVCKVIDFGIAKATTSQLTERTLFTEYGQLIGTPEYMSPEQAEMSGLDVDTRSDIFSLGVLLYELLTGSTPLDPERLRSAGYAEMQRLVKDTTAPRPSARLTGSQDAHIIAERRKTDPKRLGTLLRGELDWIVLKALEKDRTRRYETANGLSEDVRRYLEGEVVQARPPSAAYRTRKFVRRNQTAVIAGAVVVIGITLAAGLIGAAQARAHAASDHAAKTENSLAAATQVIDGILALYSQTQVNPKADAAVILERAAESIALALGDEPVIHSGFEKGIAQAYWSLGRQGEAFKHSLVSYGLLREALGADAPVTLRAVAGLCNSGYHIGELSACESLAREALPIAQASLGATDHYTRMLSRSLAVCLSLQGQHEESLALLRSLLDLETGTGITDQHAYRTREYLGEALLEIGEFAEAEEILSNLVQDAELQFGHDWLWNQEWIDALARAQLAAGHIDQAMAGHTEALRLRMDVLGANDVETLRSRVGIARVHLARHEYEQAERILREVIQVSERLGPAGNEFYLANHRRDLAEGLLADRRHEEAESLLKKSYETLRAMSTDRGPRTQRTITLLIRLYDSWGRADEAARWQLKLL